MVISLFCLIVRYGFYIVTGFDLHVCLDWSSVDISILSKSITLNFKLSSNQSLSKIFLNLILGRLSTTVKATINIWILRAVCMPKMRATTSIRIPLNLGIEVLKIVIHFRDDAGSLRIVIKDVLVYHTVPGGIAVSIDSWSLAMEDMTDYREFCKGRGILVNDSSMRSSIIFDTVLFELHESDAHILLQIVKTLHRDILTEEWSLKRGRYKRADTLIRLLRTNRLYRDGHGPEHQVVVSINTFKSTTTIDSGRVRKVNLITGPVKLRLLLHSADSQALFSTGSVAINLTCADSLQETCILRVDRTIGCRNKTVEGYLELFKSAHYPAVVFISARCMKALLVRIPVNAILLGGEQRDQKEHYNLAIRKLLCSCLTKLYRLRLDLSKISLCFDDFNDERNAVVKLTTLHFDVCQDSTNEESVSLASVLEIDELLLKNSSGSVVFSSADNSASWAVMASSQEKIDFIPRNLEMSAMHLISERFSMHLGLLSFHNAKEGLGRLLLRSLSCVTSHSKRGKIGSILLSCGYADGSSRRMGSMILRNFQAIGAIESISLEVGMGKVEMSMYLPKNRIVRTVFSILNLIPPLKRPRRPLSIALSAQLAPNQKVFPAYFPLISDREHVLAPIRAASVLLHQTGRVAAVILNVVLPNQATFILELSSIVLERYSHHRNVPLAMQSFWLVEVHRFRASTCRHSFTISARQPFLYARPQEGAIDTVVIRISLAWYTDSYAVVASSKVYASPMGAFHLLLVNNDDLSVLHSLISELFVVSPGKSNDRYASDILNLIDTRVVILPFTLHVNEGLISLSFCRQMMRSADDVMSWLAKALIERRIVRIQKLPFIHQIKR